MSGVWVSIGSKVGRAAVGAALVLAALAAAPGFARAALTRDVPGSANQPATTVGVDLRSVRIGGDSVQARVVLDLDGRAPGRLEVSDPAGGRLTIDVPGLRPAELSSGAGRGPVRAWRIEGEGALARLVLDVTPGASAHRPFLVPPDDAGHPWRLVVDVDDGDPLGALAARLAAERPAVPPAPRLAATAPRPVLPPTPVRPAPVKLAAVSAPPATYSPLFVATHPSSSQPLAPAAPIAPPSVAPPSVAHTATPGAVAPPPRPVPPAQAVLARLDESPIGAPPLQGQAARPRADAAFLRAHPRKVIVVDAGHGGHDPGARSLVRNEKDITLATALALKTRLEMSGRYRVVLTRDSDVFVPLEERVRIARRAGADLFISLHADSAGSDPTPHGASVYTLSDHGQTRVHNVLGANEWFTHAGKGRADPGVGQILLDLTQRSTRNRSAEFASALIDHISDKVDLLPRSQRDAGYFVLLAPDVPAVLLEMGFITNPSDELRLTDPDQRARLVSGIAAAIDSYFDPQLRLAAG